MIWLLLGVFLVGLVVGSLIQLWTDNMFVREWNDKHRQK